MNITTLCKQKDAALFHAPNFSIGVNLFFELNKKLAQLMNPHTEYGVSIEEHHHIHKKDAPSGTAVSLAKSVREADVKGTHIISYTSDIDEIIITHKAKSREGFAMGAILAAEFLVNKKGIFTMKDLLFNNF